MNEIAIRPRRSIRTIMWTGFSMVIVGAIIGTVYLSIFAWFAFKAMMPRR